MQDTTAPAPRIGILVVAYNAATTLAQTLDRIPESFRDKIAEVFVCDDASTDATYLVGLGYQQTNSDLPLTVIRHPRNLGYGGNQKAGYQLAIEHGLDIVVLLHGDGQYAPEILPDIVAPLIDGSCDAVFGSRMMEKGAARKGGMPLYKFVGNRILTKVENTLLGSELSEFHSGYRAYSVSALAAIPFDRNSDGFNFDTQIIIQMIDAGKKIVEIPIPTYYGDEVCYVNGMKYAKDVTADVLTYRLGKLGFSRGNLGSVTEHYELKESDTSSHGQILDLFASRPPSRVLDLGCSDGRVAERLRMLGHHVTGVDVEALEGVKDRVDHFVQADLDQGIPEDVEGPFDVVLCADVLEHVREPGRLLVEASALLAPRGQLVASVPNFAHWYPRVRTLLGRFDYDQRGILDRGHVRFFTRRSLRRTLADAGFEQLRSQQVGLPFDVLSARSSGSGALRALSVVDRVLVGLWPTLFAYQFLVVAGRRAAGGMVRTVEPLTQPGSTAS